MRLDQLRRERERVRFQLRALDRQREDISTLMDELAGRLDRLNTEIAAELVFAARPEAAARTLKMAIVEDE